MKLALFIISLF